MLLCQRPFFHVRIWRQITLLVRHKVNNSYRYSPYICLYMYIYYNQTPLMSVTKLTKYLSNYPPVVIPTHSSKIRVPVVLSDSKGLCLQSKVSSRVENNILWWSERSRTTQAGGEWLKENLPNKIRLLGNIHLYIWLGTCDFTSKSKGGTVSLYPTDTTQHILDQYQQIIRLMSDYPQSSITFLEIPIFSIARYN